jgi:DNA-binding transcriptional regulator GbsR (MarR family)
MNRDGSTLGTPPEALPGAEAGTAEAGGMVPESRGADALARLQERFVLHWGEMAAVWGINRTMGQIHALLYISPEPLSMDEIMARLKISRGNASMNLRSLEEWGVIQRVHYTGDRREYFRSLTDVWELFHTIVRERKRREFDPMMRSLRQCLADAASDGSDPDLTVARERLASLLHVLETLQSAWDRIIPRDPHELPRLLEVNVEGIE